jgi:hypothetical protein
VQRCLFHHILFTWLGNSILIRMMLAFTTLCFCKCTL